MRRSTETPVLPGNFHAATDALGLNCVCWRDVAVTCDDGTSRWLPEVLVGRDGKSLVWWRRAGEGDYSTDGYEAWHDGMYGSRTESIESALEWLRCAIDIRAGRATHF